MFLNDFPRVPSSQAPQVIEMSSMVPPASSGRPSPGLSQGGSVGSESLDVGRYQLRLVVGIPLFTTGLRYIQTVVGLWDFWSTNSMHEKLRGLFSSLPLPIATLSKELCSRCCKGNVRWSHFQLLSECEILAASCCKAPTKKNQGSTTWMSQDLWGIFHIVKVGFFSLKVSLAGGGGGGWTLEKLTPWT